MSYWTPKSTKLFGWWLKSAVSVSAKYVLLSETAWVSDDKTCCLCIVLWFSGRLLFSFVGVFLCVCCLLIVLWIIPWADKSCFFYSVLCNFQRQLTLCCFVPGLECVTLTDVELMMMRPVTCVDSVESRLYSCLAYVCFEPCHSRDGNGQYLYFSIIPPAGFHDGGECRFKLALCFVQV